MKDSNVVICTIGSKWFADDENEYEESNILVPRNIAKCVANAPGVKRFLFVSAAGADPNSPSQFLRTKWQGEQEVKKAFPDVTIFRPCMMYNTLTHMNQIHGKFAY